MPTAGAICNTLRVESDASHSRHDHDEPFLRRALAPGGVALVSPTPCVGCVIATEEGTVVGEGVHTYEWQERTLRFLLSERSEQVTAGYFVCQPRALLASGPHGPCAKR